MGVVSLADAPPESGAGASGKPVPTIQLSQDECGPENR
jgi:hypothetical protein